MLIAVLILSVVVLIEAYIIVEKEGRIIYLRKRLLKQIRMNDSLKMKLSEKKLIVHPVWGQDEDELRKRFESIKDIPVEVCRMPIEMTEVKED